MLTAMTPRETWNQLSRWWDDQTGEGDAFHRHLIHPLLDRCLSLTRGSRLLDLACGNGAVARRFASRGVMVTAVDFSETFLEIAKAKGNDPGTIDYRLMDIGRGEELNHLATGSFDAAVCSMALHTLRDIDPLLTTLARVLVPNGRFVCSIVHPYFNSTPCMSIVSEDDFSQEPIRSTRSVRVFDYLTPVGFLARAKPDQPLPHHNYHRPLSALLAGCFAAGFVLHGYHEPSAALLPDDTKSLWKQLPTIPPVLVMSFRLTS
jgi:2-polyprenyl-3-methyl-5-hydroxy-6-metoxy-1,4-benzoquinol methylase